MLELGFKVFISYLVGSLNGALLVGRLFGGVDIRKVGSGNAGGTNALRTQGLPFALLVMVVDIAKGILPVIFVPSLVVPLIPLDPHISREWLTFACGAATIFGHCYPVWFEFAGGKGAATTLGVLAGIAPGLVVPAGAVWILSLLISGYVGLATVLAAASLPVYVLLTAWPQESGMVLFTGIVAAFIVYTHRSNIRSLLAGETSRDISFSLFGRFG
ncbi:MAG: acyl-phosphate glycerol 3-phosphate acyltransferase [Chromatiales bacterium]|nr:acyl-phosphate glycerol 3-phosphate acyltransferase [Chromatiales bacterium]MDP7093052.1 glycerol-3-phosphate 1-O-acyltransferase PlsY [Gammaproteobacteria bacterium]MDP7270500.1 glycerol-3-phosphate 1-O-acyltransferase PlsY [Gammaproteobacteria bacterium]HJP05756.1 glycerol-3-phosphate 1-O-acyltransferase PlsY [Gammaproteobacteria bacterium]